MNADAPGRQPVDPPPDPATTRFQDLRGLWQREGESPSVLVGLVKADLQRRFDEGERPAVAAYLDALPVLREDSNWVLSLLYEEFCLLEEVGEAPDPDSFCNRYEPWRDSLISQLNYHRVISQAAGGMPRLPRFPEPGEYFKKFHLRSILGQGGAARVFLAENDALGGRPSALKISANRGEEPSIMARLKHRNIMQVHAVDFDEESGLRGLCMPYLPGLPLDQILQRMRSTRPEDRTAQTLLQATAPEGQSISLDQPGWADYPNGSYVDACIWLAALLADALAHAHEHAVLHRDVKPANILVSCAEGPQLLDFNLAHDPNTPERAESALRGGTLPYMAPEQLRAFLDPNHWEDVGPSADVYALGLVLRELLIGTRPEAPPADVPLPRTINDLLDVRFKGWPATRRDNPKVPHALDAIITRCLAFEPGDRYPSAAALAEDLRALLRRRPLVHEVNPSLRERLGYWVVRHRRTLALAAGAALILVCGIAAANTYFKVDQVEQVDHLEMGLIYLARSQSAANSEQMTIEYRDLARWHFQKVIQPDPKSLEARSRNLRAYHGLALLARAEGDDRTLGRMLSRAIATYEAVPRETVSNLEQEDWLREHRPYVANLYLQKIEAANTKFKPLLENGLIRSEEAQKLAIELRRVEPDIEAALLYSEGTSLELRTKIHLAAAFTYNLILTQAEVPREREHYTRQFEAIVDRALDQIDREDMSGTMSDEEGRFARLRSGVASWNERMSQQE
ncbi:serine/threonine-protein kinase [Tautonia sp. JC769]|uniref:serine/threonine-protein kinase n=1 Tax=Tautonia sp. JC769 TaxID=3232135 RepID=UPI00345ABFF5